MPHVWIECSGNIAGEPELDGLAKRVHAAVLAQPVFPPGGVRTRFTVVQDAIVADGDPAHGFVHLVLRAAAGRDEATLRQVGDAVFAALCDALAPLQARRPLAISFELQEARPVLEFRRNTIHEHLARRAGG